MATAVGLSGSAWAAEDNPEAPAEETARIVHLERAFWYCDYVATTEGLHATPIAACRFATEELKRAKFGGNFQEFLEWWRDNKEAEHVKAADARHR